jgi:hypothetical protein
MATRELASRRINPVLGERNTRVDVGKLIPGTLVAPAYIPVCVPKAGPPESPWKISLQSSGTSVQTIAESTMSPSFRSLHVS